MKTINRLVNASKHGIDSEMFQNLNNDFEIAYAKWYSTKKRFYEGNEVTKDLFIEFKEASVNFILTNFGKLNVATSNDIERIIKDLWRGSLKDNLGKAHLFNDIIVKTMKSGKTLSIQEIDQINQKDNSIISQINTKQSPHDEWMIWGLTYLNSSIELLEIIHKRKKSRKFSSSILRGHVEERYLILIPALYNLRHGLELCLKSIQILDHNEADRTHDIKKIVKIVSDYIKKYSSKKSNITSLIGLDEDDIEDFLDSWKDISIIMGKYYMNDFFTRIISSRTLPSGSLKLFDESNELFRYPQINNTKIEFSSIDLILTINTNDIKEIKNDAYNLLDYFSTLKVLLGWVEELRNR